VLKREKKKKKGGECPRDGLLESPQGGLSEEKTVKISLLPHRNPQGKRKKGKRENTPGSRPVFRNLNPAKKKGEERQRTLESTTPLSQGSESIPGKKKKRKKDMGPGIFYALACQIDKQKNRKEE